MKMHSFHFKEVVNKGYNLDIIYVLQMIEEGLDAKAFCEQSPKLKVIYQSIIRKGLISDEDRLTSEGKELLHFLKSPVEETELVKQKPVSTDFDEWWKAFPATDTFVYKNISFQGSRSFRTRKEDCRLKLNKILAEGDYTIQELIAALELDVKQKKENSVKTKTNKLTFLQNSLTYLNQRSFEGYVELIREGFKLKETEVVSGGTDI